jgi:hypothetical protein
MNVDLILSTFNRHQAEYILIGGMNFSDELMIRCQLALPESERKLDRLRLLLLSQPKQGER